MKRHSEVGEITVPDYESGFGRVDEMVVEEARSLNKKGLGSDRFWDPGHLDFEHCDLTREPGMSPLMKEIFLGLGLVKRKVSDMSNDDSPDLGPRGDLPGGGE